MEFGLQPALSLTVPTGAGPFQARTVIGNDVPAELAAFYHSANSPYGLNTISAELFYNDANDYFYLAHLESVIGNTEPALGLGVVASGVVHPRLFLDSNQSSPTNYISDTQFSDVNTGDTTFGNWTLCPLSAGWTNHAGDMALSVKRVPIPSSGAWLYGRVTVPAGAGNGAVVANLPAGFPHPGAPVQFTCDDWGGVKACNGSVEVDGSIRLWGTYSGNVSFDNFVPLDGSPA